MAIATEVLGYIPDYGKNQLISTGDIMTGAAQPERQLNPADLLGQEPTSTSPVAISDGSLESWADLVTRLQAGDAAAMAELYQVFAKGIRFYLCRQVGPQELDDRVHDAFLVVVQSIQRGELRDPRRLMGFVRTVVRRMVAAQIDREIQYRRETIELDHGDRIPDQRANPEKSFILRQKIKLIREILAEMSGKDQEILHRFYVREQPPELICDQMKLSITQFRLLKSRAKARFGEAGKKRLQPGTICDDPVRTFG
jgi:RNA polymerase sigma-70 factor, ECF subfamily